MASFDLSQPYGTVHGPTAPTLFVQNGVTFDTQHRAVELQEDGSLKVLDAVAERQEPATATDDFRNMPNEKLKQVCGVYGIEFKTRNQALAELEGR